MLWDPFWKIKQIVFNVGSMVFVWLEERKKKAWLNSNKIQDVNSVLFFQLISFCPFFLSQFYELHTSVLDDAMEWHNKSKKLQSTIHIWYSTKIALLFCHRSWKVHDLLNTHKLCPFDIMYKMEYIAVALLLLYTPETIEFGEIFQIKFNWSHTQQYRDPAMSPLTAMAQYQWITMLLRALLRKCVHI